MATTEKIRLFQFEPAWGLPSASPFCLKLETFLRMNRLPFEVVPGASLDQSPKGGLPYIEFEGRPLGDSGFIIAFLKQRFAIDPDASLGAAERAIAHAMRRMIEEHMYWVMTYSRWLEAENAPALRQALFGALPSEVAATVFARIREQVRANIFGHGLGRHNREEMYSLAIDDITALSAFLGDKPYALGDQPTTLDATAYGFLAALLVPPIASPLKSAALALPNLQAYTERMRGRYF
ncbi:MAG: glutathione S-transferase family protein [Rhodocyclaceae bacterium]|nr:glutathione S-transferase family protein [Rhodocyclaceae bacterium]MBK9954828.1 glutathione S-transferase family protein [Rhodocyclaceae bacterium]